MFCVRREDRESEWLALAIDESISDSDIPQPWPLHEAVEYVNWHRTLRYPVAVFKIDEGDRKENAPRQVYPSEEVQRQRANA